MLVRFGLGMRGGSFVGIRILAGKPGGGFLSTIHSVCFTRGVNNSVKGRKRGQGEINRCNEIIKTFK